MKAKLLAQQQSKNCGRLQQYVTLPSYMASDRYTIPPPPRGGRWIAESPPLRFAPLTSRSKTISCSVLALEIDAQLEGSSS